MNVKMILFTKHIKDTQINIELSILLYKKKQKVFDAILRSFHTSSEINNKGYTLYVYDKKDSIMFNSCKYMICDIEHKSWIFDFISLLENFCANALDCTVVHGSCVKVNNKNILLVGKRFSGKSTLAKDFSFIRGGEFLDDDCVYIINKEYFGFGFPIQMRDGNVTNAQYEQFIIDYTYDDDDTKRILFQPSAITTHFLTIDILAFPKYLKNCPCTKIELTKAEAFNRLINNIRKYNKLKTVYEDINYLVTNSYCCYLEYNNNDSAYDLLFNY